MDRIKFSDIYFTELGEVTFDGTKLFATTPYTQSLVDWHIRMDISPAEFVEKYRNYSNGLVYSELVE